LVAAGINEAFSSEGYSVTTSAVGGNFSIALDQAGATSLSISGTSVSAALGTSISASGSNASESSNPLADMDAVVAQMNADLTGAVVAFDAASGTLTFEVTSGDAGATSTIALSGADLASVQIAGTLTATGNVGDATGGKLSAISITTIDNANAAIASIDNAIEYVNSQRATLGAIQNRLDHTVSNLTNIATNTEASRSRIMDADYGAESANLAKAQIIQQAATAMLAQANQSAQSVLSLLQ